jgi:DNA-binding GntR family transcriptional regulator
MPLDSDRTYRRLRDAIFRGDYRPGQRLVERDLAKRLRTSRVPIRESLIRLETEGLVRRVPFSATFVEDLPPRDVLEIYSMRLALEPMATQLAASRPAPALVKRLRELCDTMTSATRAGKLNRLDEIDLQFHRTIVLASGHARLRRAYDAAHVAILSSRPGYARIESAPADTTANEHRRIIDAIAKGDAAAAFRLAHAHVERSFRVMERTLGISLAGGSRPAGVGARGRTT